MATMRKFSAYRRLDRPYTRVSKFRNKAFIRMTPNPRIVRYDMGELQATFPYAVELRTRNDTQMRDNAIESARMSCNKVLETKLGKTGYKFKIRIYPFHILRENPLAAGAGADRLSTGMSHAFGKPYGLAAQVRKNQTVFEVSTEKQNIPIAREALKAGSQKLTASFNIVVTEKGAEKKAAQKKANTLSTGNPVKDLQKEVLVETA